MPGFGYSGDLARCCAWGLCVGVLKDDFLALRTFIRTGWLIPLAGFGWNRPLAAESVEADADSAGPEPLEGRHGQFSPEQICLDVGRSWALARIAQVKSGCETVFVETAGSIRAGRAGSFKRAGERWVLLFQVGKTFPASGM